MSTLKVDAIENSTGSTVFQVTPENLSKGIAKAFVRVEGLQDFEGFFILDASHNISSVQDIGTGKYRVNFQTAFTNSSRYLAVAACSQSTTTVDDFDSTTICNYTASSIDVHTFGSADSPSTEHDMRIINVVVFEQ
tara:strand:+ start:18 stop:425 length:408 start_codon:yes stop_codon:yes gene_type:complete